MGFISFGTPNLPHSNNFCFFLFLIFVLRVCICTQQNSTSCLLYKLYFISAFSCCVNALYIFILSRYYIVPAGIYLLKVNNRNTRTRCKICLKLTIKTPERRHWRRSGVFIVNIEHISHFVIVFLLLTLNMSLSTGVKFSDTIITPG